MDRFLFQVDSFFQSVYKDGLENTRTPPSGEESLDVRQARFYNLINLYNLTAKLEGFIAEAGCWRGLSAYVMNHYLALLETGYRGEGFWLVDSFEGLSEPSSKDHCLETFVPPGLLACGGKGQGDFACSLDDVRGALHDFRSISYVKGWLPEVLQDLPEGQLWKFVHLDLDLYSPIKSAFSFFADRMVGGGIIVFDDYSSLYWPGARAAVDEVAGNLKGSLVKLSSGQAFWQAPWS
jgi:O-methyltransferase